MSTIRMHPSPIVMQQAQREAAKARRTAQYGQVHPIAPVYFRPDAVPAHSAAAYIRAVKDSVISDVILGPADLEDSFRAIGQRLRDCGFIPVDDSGYAISTFLMEELQQELDWDSGAVIPMTFTPEQIHTLLFRS